MSPAELTKLISETFARNSQQDEDALTEKLRNMDGPALFRILFPLAVDSQNRSPAFPAALLLYRLKPPCPLSCKGALQTLISGDWNPSIEQVPFYLAEQFGVANVLTSIEALRPTVADQRHLDTIQYWLGIYRGMQNAGTSEGTT